MKKRTEFIHIRVTPEEKEVLRKLKETESCSSITEMLLAPLHRFMEMEGTNDGER